MRKKGLVLIVIFLFICMGSFPSTSINIVLEKSSIISNIGNTLYVGGGGPNNYTTIQGAIDDANSGDIIFVYDDSSPYHEYVVIDRSINLVGENKETTVIDGGGIGDVVNITADNVTICSLNIQNSGYNNKDAGVHIWSDYNIIIDNIVTENNVFGIKRWILA